ncbi:MULTISPECIES: histone deacetylase family protein [Pseudomonas]|jgi:acetoin utilization deacetylase AcuC-like enzyme|uniref:histone deacetylase family protein n=1 Tax=Pseudomonas TaxID=286 RepID=UPI000855029E|nr:MULTISPECIES: histone deacetylase family protein [Pseudomonas]MBQ55724.1 histone deacetylase family protein [Pseudomonadaceae bacterium]NRH27613.1 histone deacetylase family protein [Pseudomonas sp. MS19]OEO25830.1 acetylpolyamine aminohydrolase [Pseudomonas sp. J237]SFT95989.1 Acetoin utilization deacetylase AcuC [Pseudomonas marincola]HCP55148.1 histone deacetylase family protein [Pseudomonas sp.]
MLTIYSDDHHLHHGKCELIDGQLMPCFEKPQRADHILQRVQNQNLGEVRGPEDFGREPLLRIHTREYLDFFEGAWSRWAAQGGTSDLMPYTFAARNLRQKLPNHLHGELGYYSFDGGAPITAGTWQAAYSAAQVALTAQREISNGAHTAFALCRPPGHHAAGDVMGGYCYLNNAAIAAQAFLDQGSKRVAILDVDYHHGNGTQSIFYNRKDVLFTSIHGDPAAEFPFFLGYADEPGEGEGEGYNFNYPLPAGSGWSEWSAALEQACAEISRYDADVIIVSLGVDTFKEDPISQFKLDSPDYLKMGERIAALGKPTLFVMEGGYAVEEIGINAVNVLKGFETVCRP